MEQTLRWFEKFYERMPLQFLEVWGRFAYLIGIAAMLMAYLGLTFRTAGRWQIGRQSQHWDGRALFAFLLTFSLVIISGYFGSAVVLVPHAQTFETMKDLSVFLCVVLFGYPALLSVPIAYGIADLIEGVPSSYISDWLVGYFINPAFYWLGSQMIGRNPDFRKAGTWRAYLGFVLFFLVFEPALWGYLCSNVFPTDISYRKIVPALAYTTTLTWLIAPVAMAVAYPLARRFKMFWAEIPDHVTEYSIRDPSQIWTSGHKPRARANWSPEIPLQMFIAGPVIALVLAMVGATAYTTLRSAENGARTLATRLQQEMAENVNGRISRYLDTTYDVPAQSQRFGIDRVLGRNGKIGHSRTFLIDQSGQILGAAAGDQNDPVAFDAIQILLDRDPSPNKLNVPVQLEFDVIHDEPIRRERWLALVTPFEDPNGGHSDWMLLTLTPSAFYLNAVSAAGSRSAMMFALFLILSVIAATLLARTLSRSICSLADSTEAIACGNLEQTAPNSRVEEVRRLSRSFNHMSLSLRRSDKELRKARDLAESSSRIKSEFLDSAAHELRTPLTPLTLLVQLLQENLRLERPIQKGQMDQIERHVRRLKSLVDELLNLSRLEREEFHLHPVHTPLHMMLADLVGDFQRLEPDRRITLTLQPESLEAEVDPVRIHQVLSNLLENARKYTPVGTPVEVSAIQEGERVRVRVIDHGPGIPESAKGQLFDRFYRAQTDARFRQRGLGIGLYISRKIVEMHGGSIRVLPTLPNGSTFEFEIPLRRKGADAQAEHDLAG